MERTPTCSSVSNLPKLVHDQVLLVESDQDSLQHHAHCLLKNSYQVTSTTKICSGLSMIANGNAYDCVLVDTENFEKDVLHFLHQVLKYQPQISIIVMAWNNSQVLSARQTLINDAIWFLRKPCRGDEICNLLQKVCTRRINYIERTSMGKSLQEIEQRNTFNSVDTMFKPPTIQNITMNNNNILPVFNNNSSSLINNNISSMFNNNISSSKGGHQSLNVNTRSNGAMTKSQSFVDISSDDDEPTITKKIGTSKVGKADEIKKPVELKRKNDQLAMNQIYCEKRKDKTPRTAWTRALHGGFMEEPQPNQMSMAGLTNEHVGSHLQIFQERENNITKPNLVAPLQTGNNMQVEYYSCISSGLSTSSSNDASMIYQSSSLFSPLKLNSAGFSFLNIDNIKTILRNPPLYPLQLNTPTTVNNSGGDQVSNYSFGDPFQPLIGEISMSNVFGSAEKPDGGTAHGIEAFSNNHVLEDQIVPPGFNSTMELGFTTGTDANNFSNWNNGTAQGIETFSINHALDELLVPPGFNSTIEPGFTTGGFTTGADENNFSNWNNGTAPGVETFSINQALEEATVFPGFDSTIEPGFTTGADANIFSNWNHGTAQSIETFSNNQALEEAIVPQGFNSTVESDFTMGANANNFANWNHGAAQSIETLSNNQALEEAIVPPGFNSTIDPDFTTGDDANNFSNCFVNIDYVVAGGSGVGDILAHVDRFGISIEAYGGGVEDSSNHGLKDSTFQEFSSNDQGGVSHPQDVQGKEENQFDVDNSMSISFLNSDSDSFGHESAGFLLPSIPIEENSNQTEFHQHVNSVVSMGGSDGRAIGEKWYMKMIHHNVAKPRGK